MEESARTDVRQNAAKIELQFDTRVYRLNAVKKAAYRFGDRCQAKIGLVDPEHVRVVLRLKDSAIDADALAGEFSNEVLDQELREVVAAETEGARNLLLAQAFSATSLFDEHVDSGDYASDPKGIHTAGGAR